VPRPGIILPSVPPNAAPEAAELSVSRIPFAC